MNKVLLRRGFPQDPNDLHHELVMQSGRQGRKSPTHPPTPAPHQSWVKGYIHSILEDNIVSISDSLAECGNWYARGGKSDDFCPVVSFEPMESREAIQLLPNLVWAYESFGEFTLQKVWSKAPKNSRKTQWRAALQSCSESFKTSRVHLGLCCGGGFVQSTNTTL